MARTEDRIFDLTLTGELALDLANTIDWRLSDRPVDLLATYEDLLRWARHTGAITDAEGRDLARRARARPKEAAAVLARAVALREALYRIYAASAAGSRAATGDLELLNGELATALARLRVAEAKGEFVWEWRDGEGALDRMLWPTARAAADLLVSGNLGFLRECAGEGCGWLFLDTSRNRSRRWCTMEICGNRAKAKRHYEQTRTSARRRG
jgi:predicted RNA-binding Zn ribbon-like protein